MGHACTQEQFPGPNKEHPVVAILAVIAIVAAMLLIAWVRLAVHGTDDIEEVLLEPLMTEEQVEAQAQRPDTKLPEEREVESAVTSSRFATGISPQ
jgi:hypothetical protein